MTFLNPFLLFGLLAAAIPIIIHLLNLRKLKTVEFSTLRFLKELQRTKMRRVKITQWILLALRTLTIIGLVMAFARPALRGSLANVLGSRAKSSMVLLIDDSPSMSTRNSDGVLFEQVRKMALGVVDLMKEGDEAFVVKLSDITTGQPFSSSHSAHEIRTPLEGMKPSQIHVPYRDAFGTAARILESAHNLNQEVYLCTDEQATHFVSRVGEADSSDLFEDRTRVFVASVDPGIRNNAANTELNVLSRIVTEDRPVSVATTTRNFGSSPMTSSLMGVYLDGARAAQQLLNINPKASASSTFSVVPHRRGTIGGYTQLEDDILEVDNRQYFTVTVPEEIRVLFIGLTGDTRFPQLALTINNDSAKQGVVRTTAITESQFTSVDIAKFDVIVCCNVKDFSTGESERIAEFVKAGGGLVLFPGQDTDIANHNTGVFSKLNIPPVQPAPVRSEGQGFVSFERIDLAHPVFTGLFENQQKQSKPGIESPQVFSSIKTHPGVRGNEIIRLSDGSGFLTEFPVDSGKVFLFSVESGLTWSDFPTKGIFAPLMYRSVLYLATGEEHSVSYVVGEQITHRARLRYTEHPDAFTLVGPSGIEERMIPRTNASGVATFVLSHPTEAGLYEIRIPDGGKKGRAISMIAVNIEPRESDLERATEEQFTAFWNSVGLTASQVTRLSPAAQVSATILEARFGVELWKYCIGLALLCALTEMVISRAKKDDRGNSATS